MINREILNDWEKMKNTYEDVFMKDKRLSRNGYKSAKSSETKITVLKEPFIRSKFESNKLQGISEGLEKWGRKDLSGAEKDADIFRSKMNEEKSKDPVKFELTEMMNILTLDNYDDVKSSVFQIIRGWKLKKI